MSEGIALAVTGLATVFVALALLMAAIQLIGLLARRLASRGEEE